MEYDEGSVYTQQHIRLIPQVGSEEDSVYSDLSPYLDNTSKYRNTHNICSGFQESSVYTQRHTNLIPQERSG